MDEYAQKLLNSGYTIEVTRKIIVAGLKGYEKKLMNSKKPGGKKLLRSAIESYKGRTRKKLLGKTEWFKINDKKRARDEDEDYLPDDDLPEGWKKTKRQRTSENQVPGKGKPLYGYKLLKKVPSVNRGDDTMPTGWKRDKNLPDG